MATSERAVIYVESGADLSSLAVAAAASSSTSSKSSTSRHGSSNNGRGGSNDHLKASTSTTTAVVTAAGASRGGSNYVIKIQIGEENMFSPVRIDVSTTGKNSSRAIRHSKVAPIEDDLQLSSSGQSSPRSDITPPPRINSGAIRFGSETSESDTESDVSSEFRPVACPAAQFAMREICEAETPSPPPMPRSIMKNPIISAEKSTQCQAVALITSKSLNKKGSGGGGCEPNEFMSLPNNVSSEQKRLKSILSGKGSNYSSDAIKAKDELKAEILKHGGKLISGGGGPSNRKSSTSRSSKALMSITENIAANHSSNGNSNGHVVFSTKQQQNEKRVFKKEADAAVILTEPNGFHLNEISECNTKGIVSSEGSAAESLTNFAGYRDIFSRNSASNPIMSEKGTIRGVKNRVRDGIATFLQSTDSKTYSDREQGRVVIYVTSMGVVRATFQRCQKVKQILRNLLIKFDERDCYMNRSIQNEIKHRLPNFNQLALPQVFLEGQHLGDAELIEKLNESGELRDLLRPYKSLSVLNTCDRCGGFRMLPCPVCNGSKKSVHRNHFTTEFVALKCMHCDVSGLVRCDLCNTCKA